MSPTDASVLSTKDRHKLRKPLVEKMRRDRINSCIEQLKVLLEKEFHKQDPNAKLVKDDVLEMTVVFLRRQLPLSGGLNAARPAPPPGRRHPRTHPLHPGCGEAAGGVRQRRVEAVVE
ncbi:transcription factor HES-5-like [Dicentrarchus labrax]|uniref:transcription factor HES-5-like n=1 Tax=Dicentrarchus labrax TaxID=13489 RepID=UPI0021F63720|nr:transcription factor HES-5-like [Dicentrarchus labrax]XP_051271626.1 transcription factor HES-5-like [Dicentrarchus labrax]XP_051271627.1 transcription factor HES-5-like [Dicentrarchus labrax]XP_051271628.1 transcription factor HES-5-like [Dicentrarchus labrax]